jgi:hypothetical protein
MGAQKDRATGSVVFVGTGFSLIAQTTGEAVREIERAQRLLYLVADPAAARWLRSLNSTAESLANHYGEGKPRSESYREMTDRILGHARQGERVCVALYGHPGVGCDPTHMVLARARQEGLPARILPGISSDACLFADLDIDPMDAGVQSYEASLFVARQPRIDTRAGLLLWQAGFVGESSIKFSGEGNQAGARALVKTLRKYYAPSHKAAVYQASWYPICPPSVQWLPVRSLAGAINSSGCTLYVPPADERKTRAAR